MHVRVCVWCAHTLREGRQGFSGGCARTELGALLDVLEELAGDNVRGRAAPLRADRRGEVAHFALLAVVIRQSHLRSGDALGGEGGDRAEVALLRGWAAAACEPTSASRPRRDDYLEGLGFGERSPARRARPVGSRRRACWRRTRRPRALRPPGGASAAPRAATARSSSAGAHACSPEAAAWAAVQSAEPPTRAAQLTKLTSGKWHLL